METRIKKNFNLLNGKCTIIPFVSGGDPDIKNSIEILKSFAKNGARILECGFNFNAPVSDGDPIQNSSYRALKNQGVETQLVVYPRESHAVTERAHMLDMARRVTDWFGRFLSQE